MHWRPHIYQRQYIMPVVWWSLSLNIWRPRYLFLFVPKKCSLTISAHNFLLSNNSALSLWPPKILSICKRTIPLFRNKLTQSVWHMLLSTQAMYKSISAQYSAELFGKTTQRTIKKFSTTSQITANVKTAHICHCGDQLANDGGWSASWVFFFWHTEHIFILNT